VRLGVADVVGWAKVPRSWLRLHEELALKDFRDAETRGEVKRPAPGETIVWQGVLFKSVETAANR
jgi:hypothetical protein